MIECEDSSCGSTKEVKSGRKKMYVNMHLT